MLVFVWFLEMLERFCPQSLILQISLCPIVPSGFPVEAGDFLTWRAFAATHMASA